MSMFKQVRRTRSKSESVARCDQCGKVPPDATRIRAQQHAIDHGHTVRFVIEDITTYQRSEGTE